MTEQVNTQVAGTKTNEEIKATIISLKKVIESQFVLSLYKTTDLFFDYDVSNYHFDDESWDFYYHVLGAMLKHGYNTIDEASYNTFMETQNEKIHEYNDKNDGYMTIKRGVGYVNDSNIESYYEEMNRYKILLVLIDKGFPISRDWDKIYSKLNVQELEDYISGMFEAVFVDSDIGADKPDDITNDLQGVIDRADQGEKAGLPFTSPLMESVQNGMALGNITMLAANSGVGKSFMVLNEIVTAAVLNQEPLVMIINEEESEKVKQDLMAYYINNYIQGAKFNKQRFVQGQFDVEEKKWLKQAKEWIERNVERGLIRIVAMSSFSINKAIKIIKKYAKTSGVKYFCIDTFKIDSDTNGQNQVWLDLMTNMVKLYDTIKSANLDVHCFVTYQLGKVAMKERYLTQNSLGTAKNVADVVSSLILMRPLAPSEKTGKAALKVLDDDNHSVPLHEDEEYFVLFWDKNRRGATNKQIVLRVDRGTNRIWDIGKTIIDKAFD